MLSLLFVVPIAQPKFLIAPPFDPHPPCPPLPQAGEGETTAGRTAMRPTPRTAWKKGWG